ncbi:hypothetical protein FQN49_008252 [Arthroderma sp. PD_2]|nr:hypothetical protein FQN49_008252 [Arthroderma sp. PD_2]
MTMLLLSVLPRADQRGRDRSPSPTSSTGSKQSKRPIAALVQPHGRRSLSPVPSLEFPTIPKLRKGSPKNSPPTSPKSTPLPASPVQKTSEDKVKESPVKSKKSSEKADKSVTSLDEQVFTEDIPAPPPHRSPSPAGSKRHKDPIISPPAPQYARHRRTSSPLKHEYAPSTASGSSESDTSSIQHYDIESSSDTSDEELEDDDIPTPLRPVPSHRIPKRASPPESVESAPTVSPPESAYRSPPKSSHSSPQRPSKTVASIFYWHDKGSWEPLHLDECNIIVTPGLIEAFEMGPNHSRPTSREDGSGTDSTEISRQPLIALELTPLVPIRRGTALDISIRSPPTPQSKIASGSNVMFRSRNPDECDKLYGLINHSRINNPTYIALQNAHGPNSNQHTPLSRHNSARSVKGGGWFSWYGGFSKSSYRASTAPPASLAGGTDSSVGTMSSAFSALKRFGAGSKMFSIARSTLTSRNGSRDGTSLYTTSTGSGSGQRFSSTNPETAKMVVEGGIGLANAKIRLYTRESATKWRDLGAARLTILPADPAPSNTPPRHSDGQVHSGTPSPPSGDVSGADNSVPPRTPTSSARPGALSRKDEKRILVRSKASGETLVDACLGESCFERVARTGIAVSIWEEFEGIAKEGGVVGGSFKVYMIQMKSEAEAAYTFGLVGKLRY